MEVLKAVESSAIPEQELFLMPEEEFFVDRMTALLDGQNLDKVVVQLAKEGFSTGISCLMYGRSYVELRDVVLQIARKAGLRVLEARTSGIKIDSLKEINESIHDLFSQFAGEQDAGRSVLLIVNDVTTSGKTQEQGMLFNRLSAAMKREMAAFNGILFLVSENADILSRELVMGFLYKMCFSKPPASVTEKMWASMNGGIMAGYAPYLSRHFDLETAQMQNVCRLVRIDLALDGELPPKERVIAYCNRELQKKPQTPIGF